jgi:hypothetical protein
MGATTTRRIMARLRARPRGWNLRRIRARLRARPSGWNLRRIRARRRGWNLSRRGRRLKRFIWLRRRRSYRCFPLL